MKRADVPNAVKPFTLRNMAYMPSGSVVFWGLLRTLAVRTTQPLMRKLDVRSGAGKVIHELEVLDATGRIALKLTSVLNNNPINVSSLAPGTHVVLVRTAQGERMVANWVKQ
jgi:hypothetical protein